MDFVKETIPRTGRPEALETRPAGYATRSSEGAFGVYVLNLTAGVKGAHGSVATGATSDSLPTLRGMCTGHTGRCRNGKAARLIGARIVPQSARKHDIGILIL